MTDLRVIAFYSEGTSYEDEAKILRASLDRVGMKHVISGFKDRGDWNSNTAAKAELIRAARFALSGPLLYIDVDAFVHTNFTDELLDLVGDADFAVHWFADPAGDKSTTCDCVRGGMCNQEHRLLSGTLYFGDTGGARRLVDAWVAKNKALQASGNWEGGGQKNLWRTVTEIGHTLNMVRLPGRYCRVHFKPYAYPSHEPVYISHSIASRENRARRGLVRAERRKVVAEWKAEVGL